MTEATTKTPAEAGRSADEGAAGGWLVVLFLLAAALGMTAPFWTRPVTREIEARRAAGEVVRLSPRERILLYDNDQTLWIDAAAGFPAHYYDDRTMVSRPLYPALVAAPARLIHLGLVLAGVEAEAGARPGWWTTWIASQLVHLAVLALSLGGFRRLLLHWRFGEATAFAATALLAFLPVCILKLSSTGTYFVPVGLAVAALWLLTWAYDRRERAVPVSWLAGGGLGLLMLVKPQYDLLLTGWIALRARTRTAVAAGAFLGHFAPLLLYVGILALAGLRYYNHEVQAFGQGGLWILKELPPVPGAAGGSEAAGAADASGRPAPAGMFAWVLESGGRVLLFLAQHAGRWCGDLVRSFGPVLLPALAGVAIWWRRGRRGWLRFAGLTLLVNLLFTFALRKPHPYLLSMTFFALLPPAGAALGQWIGTEGGLRRAGVVLAALLLSLPAWWLYMSPGITLWFL
jgi:hypothetical protein